ncbi:hypothetical protein LguiB_006601 [Lonicera macranthoides]
MVSIRRSKPHHIISVAMFKALAVKEAYLYGSKPPPWRSCSPLVESIYSRCGIFSIAWLTYSLVLTLKDRDSTSTEIIVVASAILSPCLVLVGRIPTYPPPPPQHIQEDSSVCWLDRPRPPLCWEQTRCY